MIAVSVIIPVYNAQMYLKECIESLLSQTLNNCEFIFVNDGSIDKSQEIIEEFLKTDSRIVLLNQKNQGVSVARNNGIAIAKGEYLGFVDADDYIEKDFYEKLFSIAKNEGLDIVVSNFITYQNRIKVFSKPFFETNCVFNKEKIQQLIIPFLIEKDDLNSACNKIYSRELVMSNDIDFPSGIAFAEDCMFNIAAFNKSSKVYFTDYSGYNYREVITSATRSKFSQNFFLKHVDLYFFDFKNKFDLTLDSNLINELKAKRLISSIVSLIHIFFNSNKNFDFINNRKYVKNMISNDTIQKVVNQYWNSISENKNKYNQFILKSIKKKSIFSLILATTYSNFRNRR